MNFHNLKIAYRNLLKRKVFSILNILCLTIGMTCCLLIFHYVSYEKSYDNFVPGSIYRIRLDYYQQGVLEWRSATSYPAIGPALKRDFPEVESFCRLIDAQLLFVNTQTNIKFNEKQGYFTDPSFIKMFGIKLSEGNIKTALDAPNKIILSSLTAKKYFGNEPAVGKTLTIKHESLEADSLGLPFEVTGVFDYPKNSHLAIDYLLPLATLKRMIHDTTGQIENMFDWYDYYTYIQLKPGTSTERLEAKFPAFCNKYMDDNKGNSNTYDKLSVIPVKDIHLYSNYNQEAEVNGNGRTVTFLFLIAIFIIGIAWVNYINLTTARSTERAKEVGVKKVLGANRYELIKQFFIENIILNSVSLIFSILLFYFLVKSFDTFTGHENFPGIFLTKKYWLLFTGLFLTGTFISGLYPSLVLSGFQPIKVLKGAFKNTASGILLRKSLTVSQFVVSIVLIAGTVIVYQQVQFMRKKDLGVTIDQTLVLNGAGTTPISSYFKNYQVFKNEVLQQPGVKNITASSIVMGQEIYWTTGVYRLGAPKNTWVTLYNMGIDHDFIPSYQLALSAGRNFLKDYTSDKKAAILNDYSARFLGFKNAEDAINKKIVDNEDTLTIVGVIKDYHHEGLQKAVNPLLIRFTPDMRRFYSVKIDPANIHQTIAELEKIWNKNFPSDPFNYFFLDDAFNQQYKTDILFGKVFSIFAFLAIFISCLGLLGLSAYSTLQRSKEIGIRKVLGASAEKILFMLSKDFLNLVIISFVIALPVGWYIMNNWLQDFAYRITIQWWVFMVAGLIALLIAGLTIILQAFKSVNENPTKNLRTE